MGKEIPTSGDLKEYPLDRILSYLNKKQKSGILIIQGKDNRKDIYIENGNVIFVSTNDERYRLGTLLIKAGKITPEQRDQSLELSKKNGKRQGITLVELGYLSPKELFIALREQIREIILDGFLCEEGTFRFKETHSFSDIIRIKIEIDSLIQEGLMRKEAKRRKKQDLFIQQVNELYEKFINQSLSYYDILDVGVNAPLSEIKKAYLRMVRQYHPDMSYDLPSPDVKKKIEELFTFINNAYKTLSDETKREQYNASLLKRTPDTIRGEKTKAEEQFKRGVMELKAGNFWGAADFLRGATRIDPQKAIYWAYLSMALINIPKRTKEAEQAILNAIRLEPHNAKYYVHLGNIYLKAGLNKRALRQFEIALRGSNKSGGSSKT